MKRFGKLLWAGGVLGALLTGAQTIQAAPVTAATDGACHMQACYCWWQTSMWICQNCDCPEG
jgi:hypothetical protein